MNTSQLECFVTLAATLNFVKAARQLGLSQPAVSKQIKTLETELGADLFHRTSRTVSLTDVGEQFLPEASDMLRIYYRSRNWIGSYSQGSRNPLRVGYSDPLVMQILTRFQRDFLAAFPGTVVTPAFVCDQTDANLHRLQQGQLDCVIGIRDEVFTDAAVYFTKLSTSGFVCGVARDHPFAKKCLGDPEFSGTVSSEMLWPYRQIIAIPPYLLKNYFSRGWSIIPVNPAADNIICSNENEAYALLLSGIGYHLIPEFLWVDHPDGVFFKWKETPHAPFGIYHRKTKGREDPLKYFLDAARQAYAGKAGGQS